MAAVATPVTIQTCECHVYLLQGVGKADTPSLCEKHEPEQPIHKRATRIPGRAILYHTVVVSAGGVDRCVGQGGGYRHDC